MGLADHARLLMDYNAYANRRVLEQALALDDAVLNSDGGASKGSILGNLQHVVSAQDVWLRRWQGEPIRLFEPPTRQQIGAAFAASDEALGHFAAALHDDDWERIVDYADRAGQSHSVPLGVLITHVANHGTLHRGEAGMLLAAHGRSPGDLDFVLYVLSRQSGR